MFVPPIFSCVPDARLMSPVLVNVPEPVMSNVPFTRLRCPVDVLVEAELPILKIEVA